MIDSAGTTPATEEGRDSWSFAKSEESNLKQFGDKIGSSKDRWRGVNTKCGVGEVWLLEDAEVLSFQGLVKLRWLYSCRWDAGSVLGIKDSCFLSKSMIVYLGPLLDASEAKLVITAIEGALNDLTSTLEGLSMQMVHCGPFSAYFFWVFAIVYYYYSVLLSSLELILFVESAAFWEISTPLLFSHPLLFIIASHVLLLLLLFFFLRNPKFLFFMNQTFLWWVCKYKIGPDLEFATQLKSFSDEI